MDDTTPLVPQAAYDPLTGIAWDTRLSGTEIGLYFYPSGQTVTTPTLSYVTTEFNEYQQSRFGAALTLFSNVTKLTFALADKPEQAALRFFQAPIPNQADESEELLGFAFAPGTTGVSGLQGYNSAARGWSTAAGGTLESGGNAFTTLIHEMGHGFGLAHPHDTGGGSSIFPGVTGSRVAGDLNFNQGIYTMMSYRDGWPDGPKDVPPPTQLFGDESTPMALDIAVLQAKYGANTSYRTGNDTYTLVGQNATGTGYECIWDAGGSNAMVYDGPANATIDLRPATLRFEDGGGGRVSYVQGIRGGYTIAAGVSIQTASTGAGDDSLTGNDAGCLLAAGAGRNAIVGGAGNDTVLSGGNDSILAGGGRNLISMASGSVTIGSAGQDTVIAGSGTTLVGVNAGGSDLVFAGSGALSFVGGAAASTVVGGAGSATIFGGAGGGVLSGGRGGRNVIASGTGAATIFGGGDGDVVFVQGTGQLIVAGSGNETLTGASASGGNTFFAGSGADVIGGGAASDVIFAGTGQATVFGAGGADLFVFRQGQAGRVVIGDFDASAGDRIVLQGYAPGAAAAALAGARAGGGGTVLTLSDNTSITVVGVGSLQPGAFG